MKEFSIYIETVGNVSKHFNIKAESYEKLVEDIKAEKSGWLEFDDELVNVSNVISVRVNNVEDIDTM
ncbi:hypothetical protein [Pseudalkalibacillus caeni]|uniref:Uncharacterized protein n=1 Tax=Exobacillus caeni TaxID=2574798 RepID=A0A5R9EVJ2_9BACL|nr:hypothetical protein [Pseudalkalibacillus caeni]TLS35067.1 hypothetical protein FCL54_22360 [Pseudalkalibacillus caeni]